MANSFPIVLPALRVFPSLLYDKFDNIGKARARRVGASAASTRRLPVLVVHGTRDTIVPYSQGLALAEALGAELLPLSNANHNDVMSDPHWGKFQAAVDVFLRGSREVKKNSAPYHTSSGAEAEL